MAIRVIVAIAIVILCGTGSITATRAVSIVGIIDAILLVPGVVGFCPLGALFGMSANQPRLHNRH